MMEIFLTVLLIIGPLILIGTFFAFISGAFPRKVRYFKKHYALVPQKLNGQWIWGKNYFSYHTYGHGVVLGGTVKSHYSKDGKYVSYSTRQASFFPHSEMEWEGLSIFAVRDHLRSDHSYKNKYQKKLDKINNLEGINWFFYEGNNQEILEKIKKLKGRK